MVGNENLKEYAWIREERTMPLSKVRVEIDRIDSQIKELFRQRMGLSEQVFQVKLKTNDTIYKPDREAAIVERLTKDVAPEIVQEYSALIRKIIEVSRKYQYGRTLQVKGKLDISWKEEEEKAKKVAVLSAETFAGEIFEDVKLCEADSLEALSELLESGEVDACALKLEDVGSNPSEDILLFLTKHNYYINRRVNMGRKDLIAVSKNLVVTPDHKHIAIMFKQPNRAGALADTLAAISNYGVNASGIYARKDQEEEWNYEYYLELEANLLDEKIKALVFQLIGETERFQMLGSY